MGSRDKTSNRQLSLVPGRPIDTDDRGWSMLWPTEVVYVCTPAGLGKRRDGPPAATTPFTNGTYVMTVKRGMFRTNVKRFSALERKLAGPQFVTVSRGLVVNLRYVDKVVREAGKSYILVRVGTRTEQLEVSRRAEPALLKAVGLDNGSDKPVRRRTSRTSRKRRQRSRPPASDNGKPRE